MAEPRPFAGAVWHLAASAAGPALRLWLVRRLRQGRELPGRLHERRGLEPVPHLRPPGRLLWMHAASVGETNAVLPVLQHLAQTAPLHVLLTTGTTGSAALLRRRLPELGLAGAVTHRMAPLDVPSWIDRFLRTWRPDAAVFVESELWPNMLAALRRRAIPAALLNARLSERSARRWRRLPGLIAAMLGGLAVVWARSDADAALIERLGGRVHAVGDLKAAAPEPPVDEAELDRLLALLGHRPRWLAASTHPGEDEIVADAHARLAPSWPGLLTVVAPRHDRRGEAVAALLGCAPRRALGAVPTADDAFWVCDTVGEMALLTRLVPAVFVGRSLPGAAATGGQNPLEPARLGRPVATGPLTANFAQPVAALRRAGALTVVADASELADWVGDCLAHPDAAAAAGGRARATATPPDTDLVGRASRLLLRLATDARPGTA